MVNKGSRNEKALISENDDDIFRIGISDSNIATGGGIHLI